jgi:hypothetical protein
MEVRYSIEYQRKIFFSFSLLIDNDCHDNSDEQNCPRKEKQTDFF